MHTPYEQHDQARRLRELARPSLSAGAGASSSLPTETRGLRQGSPVSERTPRVILISELPALQGALPLALQVAQRLAASGQRVLVVDLTPSASRLLPFDGQPGSVLGSGIRHTSPLWAASPHGLAMALGTPDVAHPVNVVAQPPGDCPSSAQMPRICEQLVRQLGKMGRRWDADQPLDYQTVVLLSECVGVPLDSACWQAADDVLVLHDTHDGWLGIESRLAARMTPDARGQKLVLLGKHLSGRRPWSRRRRLQRCDSQHVVRGGWSGAECFQLAWPMGSRLTPRPMGSVARAVVEEILLPRSVPTRQAG